MSTFASRLAEWKASARTVGEPLDISLPGWTATIKHLPFIERMQRESFEVRGRKTGTVLEVGVIGATREEAINKFIAYVGERHL